MKTERDLKSRDAMEAFVIKQREVLGMTFQQMSDHHETGRERIRQKYITAVRRRNSKNRIK